MTLARIPVRDYRAGGLLAYALDHARAADHLMETVLTGLGPAGRAIRPLLPLADRVARRRLEAMHDPYRTEILSIRAALGRPGPVAFNLSYEFACTARVFADADDPVLFRTLDWPFHGLGDLVEIVRLPGAHGDWITATWPGLTGVLQGCAPGRFAIVLNQAPERRAWLGRPGAWIGSKSRFMRATGLPPAHLLRRVMEEAADFDTAADMLTTTPVAAPVIYTMAGPGAGPGTGPGNRACVIERTEGQAATRAHPVAANHFEEVAEATAPRWRPRGYDSAGRHRLAAEMTAPPDLAALPAPILNPHTRLAMTLSTAGALSIAGYEGARRVTEVRTVAFGT
ncbi:MAG: hypothetical protein AAF503_14105 [Pseudomonadota bacterium]